MAAGAGIVVQLCTSIAVAVAVVVAAVVAVLQFGGAGVN